jgi:hypothetical protein
MIATVDFLDQRLTRWAFFHPPALCCYPCLHLALLFSKASRALEVITAHAVVYVLVARRTYVREARRALAYGGRISSGGAVYLITIWSLAILEFQWILRYVRVECYFQQAVKGS